MITVKTADLHLARDIHLNVWNCNVLYCHHFYLWCKILHLIFPIYYGP